MTPKKFIVALSAALLGIALGLVFPVYATRNSSGTYSLPAGNPVVSGTTISSTWANNTLSDLATEVTDSLDRSGKGGMLAALRGIDGTVAAPAYSWTSDTDTGFYRIGANDMAVGVNGAKVMEWTTTGTTSVGTQLGGDGTVSLPAYSFSADTDTGIYRVGANDVGIAVGGSVMLEASSSGVAIGGGNVVLKALSGSYALNFGSVSDKTCTSSGAQTMTGVAAGDPCFMGSGVAPGGMTVRCETFSNAVQILWCNFSGAGADPDGTGATYRVWVFKGP